MKRRQRERGKVERTLVCNLMETKLLLGSDLEVESGDVAEQESETKHGEEGNAGSPHDGR